MNIDHFDGNLTNEFRSPELSKRILDEINQKVNHHWVIMEMCGGQTHAIMKYGIDQLLPSQIEIVHGPGCPVCVTSLELIDKAIKIAENRNVILGSYGDMLRVPGSDGSLFSARAKGADVRVFYSALDAVKTAAENPDKEVVFFGIGFETTAPANGISIIQARNLHLKNYSVLVSQFCVPPAMNMILSSEGNRVQGFLAAGHVCAVMGTKEYFPISQKYQVPITVTGFEPVDILLGIEETIEMLENNHPAVRNAYSRSVSPDGNIHAKQMIEELFEPCDRDWRGIGPIPMSGWKLKDTFAEFDAEKKFNISKKAGHENPECKAGLILLGKLKPEECALFARECTPVSPQGAPMVSSEGACSACFRYRQKR